MILDAGLLGVLDHPRHHLHLLQLPNSGRKAVLDHRRIPHGHLGWILDWTGTKYTILSFVEKFAIDLIELILIHNCFITLLQLP